MNANRSLLLQIFLCNIKSRTEQLARHGRALDVPTGASQSKRGLPFGLIGLLGGLAPRSEVVFFIVPMQQRVFLALVLGGSAYACYVGDSGGGVQLGHAAHLGGAAVGLAAGLLLRRRGGGFY